VINPYEDRADTFYEVENDNKDNKIKHRKLEKEILAEADRFDDDFEAE
jgi:hypothetical protein